MIIDVEFTEIKPKKEPKKLNPSTSKLNELNDTLMLISIILGEVILGIYAKNIFTYLTYR